MDNRNKLKIIIFFIIGLIIVFNNCIGGSKDQHRDPYYHETGGWDYRRMPLSRPLELRSSDKTTWIIANVPTEYKKGGSVSNINKMVYANNQYYLFRSLGIVYVKGIEHSQAWFIADTENKLIEGYVDYTSFSDSLKTRYNLQIDTMTWKSPDDYYKEFVKTRKLPWIPAWQNDK